MIQRSRRLLALSLAAACACAPAAAAPSLPVPPISQADGPDGFDFLIGDWTAHLRKLVNPLSGSTTWLEYEGTSKVRKIAGERANMEDFAVATADGKQRIDGQTLRLYNPASGEWSLYLLDAAKGALLLPATIGRFRDGRGEFYDHEVFGGRAILVRYVWTHDGAKSARMAQSFSDDGGRTWEENWICELTR